MVKKIEMVYLYIVFKVGCFTVFINLYGKAWVSRIPDCTVFERFLRYGYG